MKKEAFEKIKQALAEYLSEKECIELVNLIIDKESSRPFSNIVFLSAKTKKDTRKYVLKSVVHHPVNELITREGNQALVEYNILQYLHTKFMNIEGCSVPHPILVIPEIEAYLMQFIDGHLLADDHNYTRYFSRISGYKSLQQAYFYAGKWLKYFQTFTNFRQKNRNVLLDILSTCEHRLTLIERSGDYFWPKGFKNLVLNYLNGQCQLIDDDDILISGRHGDFSPINIMVGEDGITVIDFLGYKQGLLPVDMLKLLVFLEDERKSITSSNSRVDTLKRTFLDGYGDLPHIQRPVLIICEAMQRIVSIWGNISSKGNLPHHHLEARLRIINHINWLNSRKDALLWPETPAS